MTARKPKPDVVALKRAVVDAALPHLAFDGFTDKVLADAAKEVGVAKAVLAELFPNGPLSLVEAFSNFADADMEASLAELDLKKMKVRERIATAVKARIAVLKPHKEAARRAAAFLSLPPHLPLAATLLYRTVDTIWHAVGDTSTDFDFYTKRAILAGVYSTTLMRWFNDRSAGETDTDEFLAARIENVMQFETIKAQVKEGFARLFPQATSQ